MKKFEINEKLLFGTVFKFTIQNTKHGNQKRKHTKKKKTNSAKANINTLSKTGTNISIGMGKKNRCSF